MAWAWTNQPQWLDGKHGHSHTSGYQPNVSPLQRDDSRQQAPSWLLWQRHLTKILRSSLHCNHHPRFTTAQPKTRGQEATQPKSNSPGNNRYRTCTCIWLAPKPVKISTPPHWLEGDLKRKLAKRALLPRDVRVPQ